MGKGAKREASQGRHDSSTFLRMDATKGYDLQLPPLVGTSQQPPLVEASTLKQHNTTRLPAKSTSPFVPHPLTRVSTSSEQVDTAAGPTTPFLSHPPARVSTFSDQVGIARPFQPHPLRRVWTESDRAGKYRAWSYTARATRKNKRNSPICLG